jgi:carboxylesterase type B
MEAEGDLLGSRLFSPLITDATDFNNRIQRDIGQKASPKAMETLLSVYNPSKYKNDLNEAYAAFYGDLIFQCPIALFAKTAAATGEVWVSRNRHVPQVSRVLGNSKAFHTAELPFVWQSRNFMTPFEYGLANKISKSYLAFASGKEPLVGWPKYNDGVRIDVESDKTEVDATLGLDLCRILLE